MTMATTQNWNDRGLAGPLCTIMLMAVMGLAALWLARPVSARDAQVSDTPATVTADAREEIADATAALRRVNAVKVIPQAVADRALGVAVFGNLVKAAFIVGGTGGDGVFMSKTASGAWSAPAFVNLAGASVGAQIGGSKTDAVVFFMDQASIDALKAGRFEFGTSITATAGPARATAETLSKSTLKGVYVYTRQEGLFAGASANGTTIRFDDEENKAVYGARATELATGEVPTPKGLEGLAQALKALTKVTGSN
jgi:lipid-binding SYLF domain-containing protein